MDVEKTVNLPFNKKLFRVLLVMWYKIQSAAVEVWFVHRTDFWEIRCFAFFHRTLLRNERVNMRRVSVAERKRINTFPKMLNYSFKENLPESSGDIDNKRVQLSQGPPTNVM